MLHEADLRAKTGQPGFGRWAAAVLAVSGIAAMAAVLGGDWRSYGQTLPDGTLPTLPTLPGGTLPVPGPGQACDPSSPQVSFSDAAGHAIDAVNLPVVGDSATVAICVSGIEAGREDTVQVSLVHDDGLVSVSGPICAGVMAGGFAHSQAVRTSDDTATVIICTRPGGVLADSGVVMQFILTRTGAGDGEIELTAGGPHGTLLLSSGQASAITGLGVLVVPTAVSTAVPTATSTLPGTETPTPTPTATATASPTAAVQPTATATQPPPPPPQPQPTATPGIASPSAPTNVSAIPGDGQATVVWAAPLSDGGAPVLSYTVSASPGTVAVTVPALVPVAVVRGLENGVLYTFTVVATNIVGSSAPSLPSAAVRPVGAPGAPRNVRAISDDRGVITVAWDAPLSDGGALIAGYTVVPDPADIPQVETAGAANSVLVTGALPGSTHAFRVSARNLVGAGPLSDPSAPVTSPQVFATPVPPTATPPPPATAAPTATPAATLTPTATRVAQPVATPTATPTSTPVVAGAPSDPPGGTSFVLREFNLEAATAALRAALGGSELLTVSAGRVVSSPAGAWAEIDVEGLKGTETFDAGIILEAGGLNLRIVPGAGGVRRAVVSYGIDLQVRAEAAVSAEPGRLRVNLRLPYLSYTAVLGQRDEMAGRAVDPDDAGVSFEVFLSSVPAEPVFRTTYSDRPQGLPAVGGKTLGVGGDAELAYFVTVDAAGLEDAGLGETTVTMTVGPAWIKRLSAAGKLFAITKVDSAGRMFTEPAECVEVANLAGCAATFKGEAAGFSTFILHSVTPPPSLPSPGSGATAGSTSTPLPAAPATPAPVPTAAAPDATPEPRDGNGVLLVTAIVLAVVAGASLSSALYLYRRRSLKPGGMMWLVIGLCTVAAALSSSSDSLAQSGGDLPETVVEQIEEARATKGDKRYAKLDSALRNMHQRVISGELRQAGGLPQREPMVDVYVLFEDEHTIDPQAIADAEGELLGALGNTAAVRVPVRAAPRLGLLAGARTVRKSIPPRADAGDVLTQGATAHGSPVWNVLGLTGAGVKVGVIDVGFEGYSAIMPAEVPVPAGVMCFGGNSDVNDIANCEAGDEPHGTGVTETLYDVAPGVQVYLSQPRSADELHLSVDWMIAQGVKVINHSVGWTWDGPGDGTAQSSLAPLRAVQKAADAGVVWVNSAGNDAFSHWYGAYVDSDSDGFLNISGAGEVLVVSLATAGEEVFEIRWDDDWVGAGSDLELWLFNANDVLVAKDDGLPNILPYDRLETTVEPGDYLVVRHASGPAPAWLEIRAFRGSRLATQIAEHSIGNPAESAASGMMAAGAARWFTTDQIEGFSSQGPTTDGRVKPEIVGADRGDTVTYGDNGFRGTSQASPHVAGLAALVLQRFPSMSPAAVSDYLKTSAEPRGTVPNNTWGYGFARLFAPEPPLVNPESYSVAEGGGLVVAAPGVLANDTDDGDSFTAGLASGPAHGTLLLRADGSFEYDPAPGYSGPDSFDYRAADAWQESPPITVTIDVQPVADITGRVAVQGGAAGVLAEVVLTLGGAEVPLAGDGTFAIESLPVTAELVAAAPGYITRRLPGLVIGSDDIDVGLTELRAGDSDRDGTVDQDDRGALIAAFGSLWTPPTGTHPDGPAGPVGPRTDLSGNVVDLNGDGVVNGVDISLWASNHGLTGLADWDSPSVRPALGRPDAYWVLAGHTLGTAAPGVLGNDQPDGAAALVAELETDAFNGTIALGADGSFTYEPEDGFTGVDSFRYVIRSGGASSLPVLVTIEVRTAPVPLTHEAVIENFQLPSLTVRTGDWVRWVNSDDVVHTVTSGAPGLTSGDFRSPLLAKGETFLHLFQSAGAFPYFCEVHPSLTGMITVAD